MAYMLDVLKPLIGRFGNGHAEPYGSTETLSEWLGTTIIGPCCLKNSLNPTLGWVYEGGCNSGLRWRVLA